MGLKPTMAACALHHVKCAALFAGLRLCKEQRLSCILSASIMKGRHHNTYLLRFTAPIRGCQNNYFTCYPALTRQHKNSFSCYFFLLTFTFFTSFPALTQADLHFYASCKIQLHQRINGFFSGFNNIKQTFVSTNFVLVASVLIYVW